MEPYINKDVRDITYQSELIQHLFDRQENIGQISAGFNSTKQLASFDYAQDVILSLSKDYVHYVP